MLLIQQTLRVAVAYVSDDGGTGTDTTYWGLNGYYTFDLASLSVGFETSDDGTTEKDGYFVGLSFPELALEQQTLLLQLLDYLLTVRLRLLHMKHLTLMH